MHVDPAVTLVMYVVAGTLTVRMKDASSAEPYDVALQAGRAAVAQPGTLVRLRNDRAVMAELLYIVSPSYVFEIEHGQVLHDDAILVARSWEDLVAAHYDLPALKVTSAPVRHRTVEELWSVLEGAGEIWRARDGEPLPR